MSSDAKKDKKAALREKKARAAAKLEEQRAKEAAMEELRERVRELLSHNIPPSPLDQVADAMPALNENPWRLVHDPAFARSFLEQLARVLHENAGAQPDELAAAVEAADKAAAGERAEKEEGEEAVGENGGSDEPDNGELATKRKLLSVFGGLHNLSRWAVSQPAFYTTDAEALRLWVRVLNLMLDREAPFSYVLGILFPTIKNQRLAGMLASADVIGPLMQFVERHMPEAPSPAAAAAAEGAAEGTDADAADEQHKQQQQQQQQQEEDAAAPRHAYSTHTFRTLLNSIKMLSVSPRLRAMFKERARPYLHLRRLAMGTARGFTPVQQAFATRCLKYFVEDGETERATGAVMAPGEVNAAMLRYWKGHVHRLFCEPLAGGAEDGSAAGRRRRTVQRGFADQQTLDAFNRNARRRLRRA